MSKPLTKHFEMPESGQFVAVYYHDGQAWSQTLSIKNGLLSAYNEVTDEFEEVTTSAAWIRNLRPIYFTS